jgi:hypothetical protein
MPSGLFTLVIDSLRHRFGPSSSPDRETPDYQPTHDEERAALARHDAAEANIVGRTLGDPAGIRAFGKGRPR